jgi:hypothetical protein
MKNAQKAVVVIATAILETLSKVDTHQHIKSASELLYKGTPNAPVSSDVIRYVAEAEAIFFEDPLRWLTPEYSAPIMKEQLTEPAGHALEFVRRMAAGAMRVCSTKVIPAQPISLRKLLTSQPPEVDQPMSLEQAVAVPGIADYFLAVCCQAREEARARNLAGILAEKDAVALRDRSELETKLQNRNDANQELHRQLGQLRQSNEKAEKAAALLEPAQTRCQKLEQRLSAVSSLRVCSWIMVILGILITVVGLCLSRAQFERIEAPNYVSFVGMGILFAAAIILIAVPSRKVE